MNRPLTSASIGIWWQQNRGSLLLLFIGVLAPLFIFGTLAENVAEQEPFFFDKPILLFLHSLATPALDRFMLAMTSMGYLYGVVPVDIAIFLFLLWRQRRGDALFWGLAVGGAALLNVLAKTAFGRLRPDLWLSIAPETTFSFPSGHAMASMAFVTALSVLAWPTRWRWVVCILGGLFTFLVGVSRNYLGVHYPSDVIAGWFAAGAWVIGVSLLRRPRTTQPQSTIAN